MRVVLFGDGAWATATLRRLRDHGHEVAAVVLRSRPSEDSLEDAARHMGIALLQPADVNTATCIEGIRAFRADVNLSIAYNQIFREGLRGTAPWFLNVHAGRLPWYRGRNVINWAIINGEREIGVTLHVVDAGIDTGPILLQRLLPIDWTDAYGEVLARVQQAIPALVTDGLDGLSSGHLCPHPQPAVGTYVGGRVEGDEWLDWSRPSVELYNKIRGISRPGPGARTWRNGAELVVWRARLDPAWPHYLATPGEVVGREPGRGVFVKTGTSTLLLEEVASPGEAPSVPRWPIGTRLGVNAGTVLFELLRRGKRRSQAGTP